MIRLFLYLSLISLIFAGEVHAYIDPGTGSYLFQIIAASILTFIFSLKNLIKYLTALIKKIISGKSDR